MANIKRSRIADLYNYTNDYKMFDHFLEDRSLVLYVRSAEFEVDGSNGVKEQPYQKAMTKWNRDQASLGRRSSGSDIAKRDQKVFELIRDLLIDFSRCTLNGTPYTKEDFSTDYKEVKLFASDMDVLIGNREAFKIAREEGDASSSEGNSSAE